MVRPRRLPGRSLKSRRYSGQHIAGNHPIKSHPWNVAVERIHNLADSPFRHVVEGARLGR